MSDQSQEQMTPVQPAPNPKPVSLPDTATTPEVATPLALPAVTPAPTPDATEPETEATAAQPTPVVETQPEQPSEPSTSPATPEKPDTTPTAPIKRIFKIGAARIAQDETTAKLSNEQARDVLKAVYPEVAHATIRETVNGDTTTVEFLPRPGTKG